MKSRLLVLVNVAALVLSCACCDTQGDTLRLDSGLEGKVLRGPMCPVVRMDDPCPDQPFSAPFEVFDSRDRLAGRFESDAEGRFTIALDPGTYIIIPDTSAPIMNPRSQLKEVTVEAHRVKQLTLIFDTGIR